MRATRLAPAAARDLPALTALLEGLGLPTAGLGDQFPQGYATAFHGDTLVGCVGLETYGSAGLLRSVAVSAAAQKGGIGRTLVANRIDAARAMKLDCVYLLTTTASDYFPRLGFVAIERSSVAGPVAASPEFASVCPSSARCFVLHL